MSDAYLGEIRLFAGNFAPSGWALCQGQTLPISEYSALFTLLGTTYGGNGTTTFNLPDLRGRVVVHQGGGGVLGSAGGVESVTLTTAQLPAHSHAAGADQTAGSQSGPGGNVPAAGSTIALYSDQAPATAMAVGGVGSAGSSQPHENRQPFVVITYIIALVGIFPSQS